MQLRHAGNNLRNFPSLWAALWLFGALANVDTVAADSKGDYEWRLPPGFPQPSVPTDNPMSLPKVQLGCRLFFETRLSVTGTYACASCHRPELAFSDGRAIAVGATGELGRRNAMSLTNVAYNSAYTWASQRMVTLEAQMERPLFGSHPIEMGLQNDDQSMRAVLTDADYARGFREAFPNESASVSARNVVKAIAAYERTLLSGRSAFDRYVFDDERDALTDAARRGMTLFYSTRSGCATCHSGLNFSGPLTHQRAQAVAHFARNGTYAEFDTGLFAESNVSRDRGRFRVPTLRNIALTAPYMHDGSIATLVEVVEHYSRGGASVSVPSASQSDIQPLALTISERDDLVAFLESLTDPDFAVADQRECSRIRGP